MSDLNSFCACGRLVADAEVVTSKATGRRNLKFRIAINGIDKNDTLFLTCIKFNTESLVQYLTKGKQIAVSGSLHSSKYQKNGVEIEGFSCWVSNIQLITEKRELPDVNDAPYVASPKSTNEGGGPEDFEDSDIPF